MRKPKFRFVAVLLTSVTGFAIAALAAVYSLHSDKPGNHLIPRPIAAPKTKAPIPDGWQKVDAQGKFTFYLPADMKPGNEIGIETYFRIFRSGNMRFFFNYGTWYEGTDPASPAKRPTYQESWTEIDGRRAKISTDRYGRKESVITLHFPDVGDGQTKLTMSAVYKDRRQLEVAKRIFSTIEFP